MIDMLFWLCPTLFGIIAVSLLVRYVATSLEEPVMSLFNKWWKPTYEVVLGRGSRLEAVVSQNKRSTTWFETAVAATKAVSLLLLLFVTGLMISTGIEGLLGERPSQLMNIQLNILVIAVVLSGAYLVISYWIIEWQRRQKLFIAFTDNIYYAQAKIAPLGFLPGMGAKRALVSYGPTPLLEEVLLATDVQDIGGMQTGWIRDRWTEYLAQEEGVGSIFIPSRVFGAEDIVAWVSHAAGTVECLKAIAQKGTSLESRLRVIESRIEHAALGSPDDGWDEDTSLKIEKQMEERRDVRYPLLDIRYDLYSTDDPGLWDRRTGIEVRRGKPSDPVDQFEYLSQTVISEEKTSENRPGREKFNQLWGKLSERERLITKLGFDQERAWLVYQQHSIEPREISSMMIDQAITEEEFLQKYPLTE